jgi:hypothetical protein
VAVAMGGCWLCIYSDGVVRYGALCSWLPRSPISQNLAGVVCGKNLAYADAKEQTRSLKMDKSVQRSHSSRRSDESVPPENP